MSDGRPPQSGDTVGHYRLDGVVGVGGMGTVHAATDLRLGRRVALKIVLGHHAATPEYVARFQREAAVLARLDSPHVVAIYDHGEHEGHPYIAMQLAAGGDLGHLLRRRGAMPPDLAARVCAQVSDALVAAHAVGVVHRDVKPANVLLRDDRVDRIHVYLSDFGVALTEATGLTTPGAIAGTWNYLAPERTRGEHGSPASDVYSVGCLFWELLTGQPPYAGTDVEVAMEHLSSPVPQLPGHDEATARANRIVARSMAKERAHRYASAAALRDDLRDLAGSVTGATPLPGAGVAPRRRRRGAVLATAGAVLAVLVAGGTTVAVVAGGDQEPGANPSGSTGPSGPPTSDPTPGPDEPVVEPVVQGDLDGDDLGDVAWYDFDRTYLASSRRSRFSAVERRQPGGSALISGDVDGDGNVDTVTLSESVSSLAVTVTPLRGRSTSSAFATPRVIGELDQDFLLADVDGDGDDDLVVATPVRGETQLTVARSLGDGSFGRSRRWYRVRSTPSTPPGPSVTSTATATTTSSTRRPAGSPTTGRRSRWCCPAPPPSRRQGVPCR